MKRIKTILVMFVLALTMILGGITSTQILTPGQKTTQYEKKTYARKNKNKNKKNTASDTTTSDQKSTDTDTISVEEDGTYTSKEEVAAYIHEFGKLPSNYISKNEAKDLGWVSSEGNLDEVAPGKSIGGGYFKNYDGLLPEASGRKYYECDIDFDGTYRNAKRLVYSNDGLIFYTEDHYQSFEQLY